MILGLDLGSKCGWSLPTGEGEWTLRGNRNQRLVQFHDRLDALLKDNLALELVAFERPFARGDAATRSLWGLAGMVEYLADRHGYSTIDYPPSTLKKWFVGHGQADKGSMYETAIMLGYDVKISHEHAVDAIAVRLYAEAH